MLISPFLALETSRVLLRPLQAADTPALHAIAAADPEMWGYFTVNLADGDTMKWWVEASIKEREAGTRIPFTIIEKSSGRITGSMSYLNIAYYDQRLEIGSSWLGREFRSAGINKHSKYIMMNYAFEQMNFEHVEYKTDVLNERARQGLRNIGGTEEGILRSHMKMWNNRRRTSIFYSVLKDEWPRLKQTIFAGIA